MAVWRATGLLTLIIVTAAGCSHQLPTGPVDWKLQQQNVTQIDQWQLDGKLGIKSPQETGAMHIAWQQQRNQYDIKLSGPLGSHATHLHGDDETLRVEQGDDIYQGTPQELLDRALGWEFPIEHIRFWARGLPAPAHRVTDLQWHEGRLSHLTQSGWDISFANYQIIATHMPETTVTLPGRVTAHHDDITLTFVIHEWTLLPTATTTAAPTGKPSDATHP